MCDMYNYIVCVRPIIWGIWYAGKIESVNLDSFDVSVIANMVKKYLRELSDPVIPEDSYSSFIEAASM